MSQNSAAVCSLADKWSSILDSLGSAPASHGHCQSPFDGLPPGPFGGGGGGGGVVAASSSSSPGIVDKLLALLTTKGGKIVVVALAVVAVLVAIVVLYLYLKRQRLRREAEEQLALETVLADEAAATQSRMPIQQLSVTDRIPVVANAAQFHTTSTPPRHAQVPTAAVQPTRGIDSESPRNVSGENDFRSFHRQHGGGGGGKKQDNELPNLPPPEMGAPVSHAAAATRTIPPGESAMPQPDIVDGQPIMMAMPITAPIVISPPAPASTSAPDALVPAQASVETTAALPTLAEDPNFVPLA